MSCPPARLALLVALALLAVGCGSDEDSKDTGDGGAKKSKPAKAPGSVTSTTEALTGECRKTQEPKPRSGDKASKPKAKLDAAKAATAVVVTTCGEFTIALDAKRAPTTASSFASLARQGFYDGLTFHRVSAGFVIQGGDPLANGKGGPGYKVVEPPPSDTRYPRGAVAMAKGPLEEPGTSGSQFFVVTAEDASAPPFSLPAEYALVGKVAKGLDVIQRIGSLQADPQTEKPVTPVVIQQVKIQEG
ncbi:MAG: peptidylprolyl isomerase [Solirubrobacteraceae bacterium]